MRTAQEQALLVFACARELLAPADRARLEAAPPGEAHLAQLLVQQRLIAPQALAALLRELSLVSWGCPVCPSIRLGWLELASLPRLACPRCGGGLTPQAIPVSGSAHKSATRASALPGSHELPPPGAHSDTRSPTTHSTQRGRAAGALPRRLGPYTLEALLGKGSCARVYLARRDDVAREFALKVIEDPDPTDHELLLRFRREVEVASRIRHPDVIPILHAGEEGGAHYYAMEYCPGPTLKERLRVGGPLPPAEAAALVARIARAIDAAHAEGVIHRDLKPANIILEARTGAPRVTDFGMARDERTRSMTATGDVLGTPFYMAPEQFRGERDLDRRVDVYALGVILYELLCGRRPYDAPTALALKRRIEQGDPPPLGELRPEVDPALAAVCARAMAVERDERYPDAAALAEALEQLATPAPPPPPPRSGLLIGLLAGLSLGLLAAAGATLWLVRRAPAAQPAPPVTTPDPADEVARLLARAAELIDARARELAPRPWEEVEQAWQAAGQAAGKRTDLRDRVALRQAAYELRRGRWADALRRAQGLTDPQGLLVCAQAQEKLGRAADALGSWAELQRRVPDGALGLVARAAQARLAGARNQAQALAREATDRAPQEPAAWTELARADLSLGDTDAQRAVDALARLVHDDPREALLRGLVYVRTKELKGARTQLDRARALGEPEDPDLLAAEAELAFQAHDDQACAGFVQRALARDPRHLPSLVLRVGLALEQAQARRDTSQLLALWQAASEVHPAAAEATAQELIPGLVNLIKQLQPTDWERGGEPAQAWIERQVSRAPQAARDPVQLALSAAVRGARWDEIASASSRALSVAPRDPELHREAARLLLGRGLAREALLHLEDVPADAERERLRAESHWQLGRPGLAADVFEAAATSDPQGCEGLTCLASLRWLEGRDQDALTAADQALRARPDHFGALLLRGLALAALGRDEEAMAAAKEAHRQRGFLDVRLLVIVSLAGTSDDETRAFRGDQEALALQRLGLRQADALQRTWVRNRTDHMLFLTCDLYSRRQEAVMFGRTEPGWREDAYYQLVQGRLLLMSQQATPEAVRVAWRQARALDPRLRFSPADLRGVRTRVGRPDLELEGWLAE